MDKYISIINGLILLIIGIVLWGMNIWNFGDSALILFKGVIIWIILLAGVVMIILGINELMD